MAKLCECCGKLNKGFKGDPLYLEDGKILCCNCAEPIRKELSQMYDVKTREELNVLTNSIIEKSKQIFDDDIMNYIYLYINKRERNVQLLDQTDSIEDEEHMNETAGMFENIGNKIKALAQIITWMGIISSIVSGILLIVNNNDMIFLGIVIIVVGSLGAWISSFLLYGFGQLVENSDKLLQLQQKK